MPPMMKWAKAGLLALATGCAAGGGSPAAEFAQQGLTDADGCFVPVAICDAAPPSYGPTERWRNFWSTRFTRLQGAPRHRGRDLLLREGEPQWIIGKFAYGPADKDLTDEDVDIYVSRHCSGWEKLATVTTTRNNTGHPTVERIEDDGGRVYFRIPDELALPPGFHRVHFVVKGDHSSADSFIQVVGEDTPFLVSDVDGTLTEGELAEVGHVLLGRDVGAQPYAAEALWAAADAGYQIFYLTARPDWLTSRTHAWLREQGFPQGLVHTTLGGTGANGDAAILFKTTELSEIDARSGWLEFAVGNTDTDAAAYENVGIAPDQRFLYQLDGDLSGGTYVESYAELGAYLQTLPPVCR